MTNTNTAPFPDALADIVSLLHYKAQWQFTLEDIDRGQGSAGLTLCILITTPNSYNPEQLRRVMHYMPVPPAAFDTRSWRRWLLDQILLVESHEACEFFRVGKERPYAPSHGPGNNPYLIREVGTTEDVETSYLGDRSLGDRNPNWRCENCGSNRWVTVSLTGGRTRQPQCVPCGSYRLVDVDGDSVVPWTDLARR